MTEARRFTGGRIFTGRRFVEALLVEDGRVVSLGSEEEVARASPTGCEGEDLSGGLVAPGLVDAHLHVAEVVRAEQGLPLEGLRAREEIGERLRRWAEMHPAGPIVGRGWSVEGFSDGEEPTRRDIESVVADRPVVLYHVSGHAAIVNGYVLDAAGITAGSPDPPGGRWGRGPDGTPNGRLYERALGAVARFSSGAYPPDPRAIGRTLRSWAALGVTTVGTLNTDPEELEVLATLAKSGDLPVRVRAYLRYARFSEVDFGRRLDAAEGGLLSVRGTKSFADGAFGPRTAWLSQPYADRPDSAGDSTLGAAELAEVVERTVSAGLVPAVHAIGDRALGAVLHAMDGASPAPTPLRVEHAALVPPELHSVLDRVRPALVVQPGFVWSDGWLRARLGPERARFAYPFRTLTERGHLLIGSSDAPYDPVDPWRGLAAAVHRTDPEGRSANPDPGESLSEEQAFQLYTSNAGRGFGEADLGTLEVGARADLVVLDAPDLGRAIGRGRSAVRATWRGGELTYRRERKAGE
ncbi:MAG: amidohydrolase [Thermoplasmata archaeon]